MPYIRIRRWPLVAWTLLSACGRNRADDALRANAADVLAIPRVWAELRAYSSRNGPLAADELLYLDALRRVGSDSTFIKISALVDRSQVAALRPCALVPLQQHWVLLKTGNCAPDTATVSQIDRYVRSHQRDNTRLHYRVDAKGDSMIMNNFVTYDSEIVYLTVYKNVVVKVEYSPY